MDHSFVDVGLCVVFVRWWRGGGSSPPPPPTVTTSAATAVTLHTATLNGIVNPHAQATNAWFAWGTDSTLATSTLTPAQAVGAGSADNTVSAAITGLTFGTTYYYRVVAMNASGTENGAIVSFATGTPNSAPTVTTDNASSVTVSGAVLNGTVNPNELATTAVFEWGTDPTLVTHSTTSPAHSVGTGSTSVAINDALSGLTPGVTYYYRVSATNSVGTSTGAIVSFTPTALAPTVATGAATAITLTGATLNGTVNPNGLAVTDAHFEWGTDPTLTTVDGTTAVQTLAAGFTGQAITASLSGLAAGNDVLLPGGGDQLRGDVDRDDRQLRHRRAAADGGDRRRRQRFGHRRHASRDREPERAGGDRRPLRVRNEPDTWPPSPSPPTRLRRVRVDGPGGHGACLRPDRGDDVLLPGGGDQRGGTSQGLDPELYASSYADRDDESGHVQLRRRAPFSKGS